MKKTAIIALCAVFMSACASTHPGTKGTHVRGARSVPLIVSAEKQDAWSTDHYTFVTFTVENDSDDMLRVKNSEMDLGSGARRAGSVIVGQDLVEWAKAHEAEMERSQHNKKVAQNALLVGGLGVGILGAATHAPSLAILGLGAAAGGAGWSIVSGMRAGIRNAKNPKKVPREHVYAPFTVPAGMIVRKWAVIQHPRSREIKRVNLSLKLVQGVEETYAIALD